MTLRSMMENHSAFRSLLAHGLVSGLSDDVYSQNLLAPYDIRVMSASRRRGQMDVHFSIPTMNLNYSHTTYDFPTLAHRHNFFELMFVLSGTVEQYIEGGRYQYGEGTVCLMNTNTEHGELLTSDFSCAYLCLSRKFLREHLVPLMPACSRLQTFFAENLPEEQSGLQRDYIRFIPCGDVPTGNGGAAPPRNFIERHLA